jgi:hypothetical protein
MVVKSEDLIAVLGSKPGWQRSQRGAKPGIALAPSLSWTRPAH